MQSQTLHLLGPLLMPYNMPDDPTASILTEQLKHINSIYKARIAGLDEQIRHQKEISDHRLEALEEQIRDHETRIRTATEGVTQFKLFSGLASGGSGLMSILALLKAFLNF